MGHQLSNIPCLDTLIRFPRCCRLAGKFDANFELDANSADLQEGENAKPLGQKKMNTVKTRILEPYLLRSFTLKKKNTFFTT